jgi:methylmalonyl-CoA epimerase
MSQQASQPNLQVAPGASVRRIDHVGMLVRDADIAATRFVTQLGLTRGTDWVEPGGRFRLLYLEAGDTTLQLVQPLADGPLATALAANGEGLHHICFAVDDLDRALTGLAVPVAGPPYVGGKGTRVCFLAEPTHGVVVELTEAVARDRPLVQ